MWLGEILRLTLLLRIQVLLQVSSRVAVLLIRIIPDGAMTQNGTLLFSDDATIQCVAVSVSSVSAGSTDESCLTLTLSPTTTVTGLTISPDVATVCVTSADGIANAKIDVVFICF